MLPSARAADENYASGRLLTAVTGTGTLPTLPVGLNLTMQEGWYTYWRMPGDSGLAPAMDWSSSKNVKTVEVHWPAPRRYAASDLQSFGYEGDVIFPLTVTPVTPGEDVTLALKLNVVVCHEICIPQTMDLTLSVPKGPAVSGPDKGALDKAIKSLPSIEDRSNLKLQAAVLGKGAVVVTAWAKGGFDKDADVIVETPLSILTAPPERVSDSETSETAIFKVKAAEGLDLTQHLFGKDVTVTLINKGQAVEKKFSF